MDKFERNIIAEVKMPKIKCPKTLFSKEYAMPIIKIVMKKISSFELFKIPFINSA